MWEIRYCKLLDKRNYLVYSLDNSEIIHIPFKRDNKSHKYAIVYYTSSHPAHRSLRITNIKQDGTRADHDRFFDDNLDVLKLKCLVRAKELGWDIKDITIGETK